MKPVVAITMGDPAGVGPEVIAGALKSVSVRRAVRPVVVGDKRVFELLKERTGLTLARSVEIFDPLEGKSNRPDDKSVAAIRPGRLPAPFARAVPVYIEAAVRFAQSGRAKAVVTAPINKGVLKRAGFDFPGHTEFLAHLTGTKDFVMMLGGERLKVVLVTVHEPISKVPSLVTREKILKTIKITDRAFKEQIGIKRPRIAVAGLNPHAGEGGLFGGEEASIIAPSIKRARRSRIDATGPHPPDTVFYRAVKGDFDCVVCMYHDQGLGPLKLIHFEDGINATLGLPIIRTSVDHGTAYDIAWKGKVDARSMKSAILAAAQMAMRAGRVGRARKGGGGKKIKRRGSFG